MHAEIGETKIPLTEPPCRCRHTYAAHPNGGRCLANIPIEPTFQITPDAPTTYSADEVRACGCDAFVAAPMLSLDVASGKVAKIQEPVAACEDCGLPYVEFLIDVVLPDADWLAIHPVGLDGLLCAKCIARRAAYFTSIVIFARLVSADDHERFRAEKNTPFGSAAKLADAISAALAHGDSTHIGTVREGLADAANAYRRQLLEPATR